MGDGRQRVAPELRVDVPPAEVVDDGHGVALVRQVDGRRPAAEAVAAQDEDLLGAAGHHAHGRGRSPRGPRAERAGGPQGLTQGERQEDAHHPPRGHAVLC